MIFFSITRILLFVFVLVVSFQIGVDAIYPPNQLPPHSLHSRQLGGMLSKGGGGGGGSSSLGGGCKAYFLVGARGTTEGPSGSMAYNKLVQRVLAAVPGGGKHEIPYSSSVEYMRTPKEGAQMGLKFIKQQVGRCPSTVFVLLGYSKGAMVATQIMASKDLPPNKLAAAAMFGNPYYSGGQPQNKCAAKTGKGIAASMMVRVPREYVDKVFDCCLNGDMICQTMGSMTAHLGYSNGARSPADQATTFVLDKLKQKLGQSGGAGKGSSASSNPPSEMPSPGAGSGGLGGLGSGGPGGGMPGGLGGAGKPGSMGIGGKSDGGLGSMGGGLPGGLGKGKTR